MVKKLLCLLFLYSGSVDAMQFKLHTQSMPIRALGYGLGSLAIGFGASCLVGPKNNFAENFASSLCLLKGLDLFLKDNSALKLGIPFFSASLIASQTRDRNRSIVDHIRALSAGGLLAGGLSEFAKNLYQHNFKESLVGLGLCAAGGLLLSQKDIKTFFGRQRGNSLNPPEDLKKFIKKDHKLSEEEVDIPQPILRIAKDGQKEAMPFCYCMASFLVNIFNKQGTESKEKSVLISRLDLVTKVLPYLRTDVELTKIPDERLLPTVFSVDPLDFGWLRKELIIPYRTLADYKPDKS